MHYINSITGINALYKITLTKFPVVENKREKNIEERKD